MSKEGNQIFKLRQRFLALFIILILSSFFIVNYIEDKITESYLAHTTKTYQRAYNTIYTQYNELADVIFTGLLKLSNIKQTFKDIDTLDKIEQKKIRDQLYKNTIERFKTLQLKHIRSVNFILPDNSMFLKVKQPSKFGQQISDQRDTIHYVHKHKKPINSFEVGKYGAGFRFIYPIIDKGNYLGIIGITFGAEAITSSLMKQYYVLSNFFIDETSFNQDFFKKKPQRFKKSHHKGFVFDLKVLKELKKVARVDMAKLKPNSNFTEKLYQNIVTNKFIASFYDSDTNMIFTHIPIFHSVTNKKEAVLTIRSKYEVISILHSNYIAIQFLMMFLIATLLYLLYQHNLKLLQEKHRLKENIQKDKQLLEQAKMAQMGEMLGNIAHQWRQPLSTISTAASGMKMKHEYNIMSEDDIPKHMDAIVKNVDYLSQTIDTFRDFIKEDAQVIEIKIQEKIDKTIEIVSATLQQSHIELINNINYETPYKVTVISGALPQVIINIINNAKDAIKENNIEDGWIKLDLEKKDQSVLITIEDNAHGIPSDIISRVFDPYFTTKHQSVGTGLGLFMSHKIVTEHLHGKLSVKNTKNGAKFTIELPLQQTPEYNRELS
jgi:two-component system, NtrC family, C4-dicarboxylate transport sensor histidine kinase DctB